MLSDQQQASDSIAKSLTEIARLAAQNETDTRTSADLIRKGDGAVHRLLDGAAAGVPHASERRLRADHMAWKRNLAECLVGLTKIDPRDFSARNQPFGPSFAAISEPRVRDLAAYRALAPLLDTLVRESGRMVAEASTGNIGKAIEHYMTMDGASGEAMGKLGELCRALGFRDV